MLVAAIRGCTFVSHGQERLRKVHPGGFSTTIVRHGLRVGSLFYADYLPVCVLFAVCFVRSPYFDLM